MPARALHAPLEVLLGRVTALADNPSGKDPAEQADIARYVRDVEPLIRRRATCELDSRLPVPELAHMVEALLVDGPDGSQSERRVTCASGVSRSCRRTGQATGWATAGWGLHTTTRNAGQSTSRWGAPRPLQRDAPPSAVTDGGASLPRALSGPHFSLNSAPSWLPSAAVMVTLMHAPAVLGVCQFWMN